MSTDHILNAIYYFLNVTLVTSIFEITYVPCWFRTHARRFTAS